MIEPVKQGFTINPDGLGPHGCQYLTRKGAPCPSPAVTGTKACSGHSGRLTCPPAVALAASVAKRRERKELRRMTALDHLARELQREAQPIARALTAAAKAGDVRAAELLLTRVHGKPVERVETSTSVEGLGLEELRALRDRLLAEHPELRGLEVAQ